MSGTAVVYLLVAPIPLCGILCVLMPRLVPRGECFTVTIPEGRADDPRLIALRRRYTLTASVLAIVETLIALALATAFLDGGMEEGTFLAAYVALFLLMFPLSLCLMLRARRKVKEIEEREGWQAETGQAEAGQAEAGQAETGQAETGQAETGQAEAAQAGTRRPEELVAKGPAPRPLSPAWNLLYVPVLLFCAALVLYLYPSMPDRIPLQANLSGEVTRFVDKSPVSALLPVWIDLFFAACFAISHWSMNRQKPPVDLAKPTTSAYAFGAYRRATCIMLLVSGILLCLSVGAALPLSSAGILTVLQGGAIVLMAAVVIVVGCIILAIAYGQNGSRLFGNAQACAAPSRDDDKHWKAGVFYVNADDPAMFVPKRLGVGTTINFGSKPAIALVVGLIAVAVLFAVLVSGM